MNTIHLYNVNKKLSSILFSPEFFRITLFSWWANFVRSHAANALKREEKNGIRNFLLFSVRHDIHGDKNATYMLEFTASLSNPKFNERIQNCVLQ